MPWGLWRPDMRPSCPRWWGPSTLARAAAKHLSANANNCDAKSQEEISCTLVMSGCQSQLA